MAYKYFLFSDLLSYNLGVIAFYLFTMLIFVTLYLKIPYNIWKLTHNLFGIPMIFVLLHVILISSDVSNSILLKVWMLTFVVIAIISFIYKRFLYDYFGGVFEYSVSEIKDVGNNTLEISILPKHDILKFKAGQFAFISFSKNVSNERHPFTISSSINENNLRFSVNKSGDYTKEMGNIALGDNVLVYGPYGHLGEEFELNNKDQVWLAGGIGVTPFLSRLSSVSENQHVTFYYLTSTHEQAIYHNEIINKIGNRANVNYINHCSSVSGHVSYSVIQGSIRDIKNTRFFLCGPLRMVESMTEQLVNAGAKPSNIIFEEFDFKS
jgi:predicted ferric reductase